MIMAEYDTAFVRRCATDETYDGELLNAGDFNRWLAQVKAEAWDKGYVAACDRYGHELGTYGDRMEPNPYREKESK